MSIEVHIQYPKSHRIATHRNFPDSRDYCTLLVGDGEGSTVIMYYDDPEIMRLCAQEMIAAADALEGNHASN